MRKRTIIAIVLLSFFVVVTIYALVDEPRISGRGTRVLTVTNPNPSPPRVRQNNVWVASEVGKLSGGICVYYKDAEGIQRETSISFSLNGGESERYPMPGEITGWSTLYCSLTGGQ